MAGFLSAHGYDPGPTQRPLLAGALTGLIASVPAIALLWAFNSLQVEARILDLSVAETLAVGWPIMAVAGALYSRLFGRAANDRSGGWLSGMAFGFILWAGGAVLVLPAASGGMALAGPAALGVFLSLVLWGAALGILLPIVHRPLKLSIESESHHARSGPLAGLPKSAASARNS
jgi:hypothetical protein